MTTTPTDSGAAEKPLVVRLSRPLGTLSSLTLRRPTAAEIRILPRRALDRSAGGLTFGDLLEIAASCSGVAIDELRKLPAKDARAVALAVAPLLAVNPTEGEKRVRDTADGGVEIDLAVPLQLGSELLEKLKLVPCNAGHLYEVPLDPSVEDLLTLGGRLALQPAAIVDRLDVADAILLSRVASRFFASSRETGG